MARLGNTLTRLPKNPIYRIHEKSFLEVDIKSSLRSLCQFDLRLGLHDDKRLLSIGGNGAMARNLP